MPALPQKPLTPLERRLLELLARGQSSAEAASALRLTVAEVESLLADLLRCHGVESRHQLCVRALVHRWI